MFPHRKDRRLRREHPVVMRHHDGEPILQRRVQRHRLRRIDNLGGPKPLQLRDQRRLAFNLRHLEIPRGKIDQREAEHLPARADGGDKVVSIRRKHPLIEVRAGRKNLRHLALHELAGLRLLHLIADGDLATRLENPRDVAVRRVMRDAAHRHHAALGQGDVQQLRASLRVLEEHLVEIAEAKQQQRIPGQFAFDAAILRHHGCELGFVRHVQGEVKHEPAHGRNDFFQRTR